MSERLFPREAEQSVLGGILLDNSHLETVRLHEDDFSEGRHKLIWRSLQELRASGMPLDEVTLSAHLSKHPHWDRDFAQDVAVGGLAYISQLALRCPTKENTLAYARIVREAAQLRLVQQLAVNLGSGVTSGADLQTLQGMLESTAATLVPIDESRTLAEVPIDAFQPGLPSGIGIERFVPGGIPRDKVSVIFGDTGNFKTTVKNAVLFSLARSGHRILDVSLEDPSSLTVARYLAQKHGRPYGAIATGQVTVPPLDEQDHEVLGRIIDGSRIRPRMADIVASARTHEVDAVFLDYIQLLDGCSADHTELAEAVRQMQLSAARDGIAYVFVSQVKQDVKYRSTTRDKTGRPLGDPRATIRDTLGSSAISTGTKLGLSVFRPWSYCPVPTSTNGPVGVYCEWINNHANIEWAMATYPKILEVIVDKNVLGPAGPEAATQRLLVEPETGKVTEFTL